MFGRRFFCERNIEGLLWEVNDGGEWVRGKVV